MWNLTQRHPEDESLIAYLDGELSKGTKRRIAAHLESCWQCRARTAQLELGISTLAHAYQTRRFPAPEEIERSRQGLLSRLPGLMDPAFSEQRRAPAPVLFLQRAGAFALAAAIVVAVFLPFSHSRRPSAKAALAAAQSYEESLVASALAVHEVIAVEMSETAGAEHRNDASRLELWSDGHSGRFASRWASGTGIVRCALWRSDPRHEQTYFRTAAFEGSRSFLVDVSPEEMAQFETSFMRWLAGNRWQLVTFGRELAHFAGEDGTVLKVERVPGSTPALRLTARREMSAWSAEMVLVIDEASHRPCELTVRYVTPGREVTVRLAGDRMETVQPSLVPASAFRPDVPAISAPATPAGTARTVPPPARVGPADLDASEIEALYLLHQDGVCSTERIDINRKADHIELTGMAGSADQLRRIREQVSGVPYVTAKLQAPGVRPTVPVPVRSRPVEIHIERSAIADRLEEFLARESSADLGPRLGVYSEQAVSTAQEALSEAWALRRLGEQVPPALEERLPARSRRLVAIMVQNHTERVRRAVEDERSHVGGFLSWMGAASSGAAGASLPSGWQEASLSVFRDVEHAEQLSVALFARPGWDPAQTRHAVEGLAVSLGRAEDLLKLGGGIEVPRGLKSTVQPDN